LIAIQTEIQITQSVIYFISAAIPIYLTCILKKRNVGNEDDNNNNDSRHFKLLTTILAGFVLMQAFSHIVGALGFNLLSKGILEPLSFGTLLFFGVIYFVNRSKAKMEELNYNDNESD
jgi:hypothetical protein